MEFQLAPMLEVHRDAIAEARKIQVALLGDSDLLDSCHERTTHLVAEQTGVQVGLNGPSLVHLLQEVQAADMRAEIFLLQEAPDVARLGSGTP